MFGFQHPLDTSKLLISCILEKKIDISITKYIIIEILPHVHVESLGFKQFMHDVVLGYGLKSTRTLKRSIWQMYVVICQLVIIFCLHSIHILQLCFMVGQIVYIERILSNDIYIGYVENLLRQCLFSLISSMYFLVIYAFKILRYLFSSIVQNIWWC